MQKCYTGSARCMLMQELATLRRGVGSSSRHFSVSSSSREENPNQSSPSEYKQNFPRQTRDNSSNASRPNGPLLRRPSGPLTPRPIDLGASLRTDAPPPRQNAFNTSPAQSTTVGDDFSLPISREFAQDSPRSQQYASRAPSSTVDARRAGASPTGQRLLRRPPPRTGGLQSTTTPSGPYRGRTPAGASRGGRNDQPRRRRRETDQGSNEDEMDTESLEEKMYGPQPVPKSTPYEPKAPTMQELRLDWPATAISAQGLAEIVQQRAESLAKRIPHGFLTPQELAERFHAGELVHFESESERAEVLQIATSLAKARSDMLTERKGEAVVPQDMSFSGASAEEKKKLGIQMVKGEYPALQRQRMPFLNQVVQNLRNNGTYHEAETGQFMAKIESFLPAANKGRPQAQKGA